MKYCCTSFVDWPVKKNKWPQPIFNPDISDIAAWLVALPFQSFSYVRVR